MIINANMNMINTRSPSKAAIPVAPAIGITNKAVSGNVR
jgi:hypothetical protein